jgi:hypothetical protein
MITMGKKYLLEALFNIPFNVHHFKFNDNNSFNCKLLTNITVIKFLGGNLNIIGKYANNVEKSTLES